MPLKYYNSLCFNSSVGLEQQPSKLWVLGSNPNGITPQHSNHTFEKRGFYLRKVLFFIVIALLTAVSTTQSASYLEV